MAESPYPTQYPSGERPADRAPGPLANAGKPYTESDGRLGEATVEPAPTPVDGGVTPAQHYSLATSASRDELMSLHRLLEEADKTVLRVLERFQQS